MRDAPLASEAHEKGLIGALLLHPQEMLVCRDRLSKHHFTLAAARSAWESLCLRFDAQQEISLGTTVDHLQRNHHPDATSFLTGCENAYHMETYQPVEEIVAVLEERRVRRTLAKVGRRLAFQAERFSGDARDLISKAVSWLQGVDVQANGPLARDLTETVEDARTYLRGLGVNLEPAMATGFAALDRVLRLRPGQLGMIQGRTSEGKSAIAQQIALFNAFLGRRVAIRSLEMTRSECVLRAAAQTTGLPLEAIERPGSLVTFAETLEPFFERFGRLPLMIEDEGRADAGSILGWMSRLDAFAELDMAVIDHVGLVAWPGDDTRKEMAAFGAECKRWAVAKRATVVILSQITDSEPGRKPQAPMLGQTRDCRDLEHHADWILAVHRPGRWASREELERDPGKESEALALLLKQRNGWTGPLDMRWDGATIRFRDVATHR